MFPAAFVNFLNIMSAMKEIHETQTCNLYKLETSRAIHVLNHYIEVP